MALTSTEKRKKGKKNLSFSVQPTAAIWSQKTELCYAVNINFFVRGLLLKNKKGEKLCMRCTLVQTLVLNRKCQRCVNTV